MTEATASQSSVEIPLAEPPFPPARTALVLSGGGANGAVEVGFYKALVESGIKIDLVLGTSVGALNGAMIASGLSPDEIYERWRATRRSDLLRVNWRGFLTRGFRSPSLCCGDALRRFYERVIPARRFDQLVIPFATVATDLRTGEVTTTDEGDLIEAVRASTAIPGIFPPVEVGGRQLVDGGVLRQIPLDLAVDRGATTCIVALSACRHEPHGLAHGFMDAWTRSFSLAIAGAAMRPGFFEGFASRVRLIVLEPCFTVPVSVRGMFDLSCTEMLFKLGWEYARARLEQEVFPVSD
jgi:NTE family protein